MILKRSENAKRNGIWGLINNLVSIFLPFIVRTIMIKELGAEYLGLSSLFTSILSVLNMTELGFGTAVVYSMYKPLADDNTELLCALLNFYKKIYRIIGLIILIVGVCLLPFLHYFVEGEIPRDINLYILYILYLLNTSLSYWLFAYKNSILTIYQRNDIKNKISIILSTLMYIAQIILIVYTHNYYYYVIALLVYTVINNILPAVYIDKLYPKYVCVGNISKDLRKDIKVRVTGLMITKLSSVSRNAFDSIIISSYFGLTTVAIYNNYYYIINALTSIMLVLTTAISAGVGNSIATDTSEKNLNDMNIINFWYMWIAGWFMVCLVCLFQPFMKLWVGSELMLSNFVMWLFAIYFLILKLGDIQAQYFDAAGLWWHRRWYSITEAVLNIILNIILGYYLGVSGIVLATIITVFFVNFWGSSSVIFKKYFKVGLRKYIIQQIKYVLVAIINAICVLFVCSWLPFSTTSKMDLFFILFIRAAICVILPNFIFWIAYRKTKIFEVALPWIKSRIRH